ncbi:Fc.00g035170.m01.CDS01 [Cosmosporella sp. VM-42]
MDEDRLSASSAESDHDNDDENDLLGHNGDGGNDADEVMEDADEGGDNDADADADDDNNDEDEEEEGEGGDGDGDGDADGDADADADADVDAEGDNEGDADGEGEGEGDGETEDRRENADTNGDATINVKPELSTNGESNGNDTSRQKSATPLPPGGLPLRPMPRPEVLNARLYDIVPTMAAPQSTSVNAMAITPDLRYWITGGSDGYIRKYDGPSTINGKLPLTVAQRHPFVDSVLKAGILMSYWENEEPTPPGRGDQEHVLSPVYSLAVHSQALWLLSGLESGGINLQSVRHDEGKRICCLQQHTNAVSVLTLAQDEKSVLSGSWDKNIFDWDLNTGQTKRTFDGSGGQISAIELRPASGDPIPEYADEPLPSTTMATNNGLPPVNGNFTNGINGDGFVDQTHADPTVGEEAQASPAHESLFGGSDAGSLFGETAGDQPFGHDDDDQYGASMGMSMGHEHEGGMDHSADLAMTSLDTGKDAETQPAFTLQPPEGDAMDLDAPAQGVESGPAFPPSNGANASQTDPSQAGQQDQSEGVDLAEVAALKRSQSPAMFTSETARSHDPSQTSDTTFLSAATDGNLRLWDKRVPDPVARIGNRPGVPPWCMGTCWSPNGNLIYAGRRNGTVEEYDIRKAKRGWEPERVLKFPAGSGAVSAVRPMLNGRHLVCASYDILRLYDLRDTRAFKHSTVPFLIIPGPPRAGVISSLYIDPTSRFMLSAAGTRGWEGTSTEVLIGYEINVSSG